MNIEYDITKDVRYKQGKEQGIEQGIEKGDMKRAINVIVNMRDKGFEVAFISELVEEPVDFVTMILAQLKHRDSIFSLLKAGKEAEEIAETLNVSPWLVEVLKEDLDQ